MSRMILWRHARTGYNADGRLQGSLDIPLGAEGHAQAAHAARRLVLEFGEDLVVVSSPLSRALDTADALASLIGAEVEADARLTQRSYGAWEGLTWADVQARWPEELKRRQRGEDPDIPGWGVSADVAARVGEALQEYWDPERTTVVVSHGSAIALGMRDLLEIDPLSRALGSIPHAAWHEIQRVDSGAWHIEAFGRGAD